MIRNVVFDMGKVILEYEPLLPCYRHARDWQKANQLCNAIFRTPEWLTNVDGGLMTDSEYALDAQKRLDTPELKAMAADVLADWWHDSLFLKTGMDVLIAELLDAGVNLYVLSNVSYSFREFCYKIPHFDRFSGAMISSEEKLRKPDPALFRRLCERYSLKPEECLFVDDLDRNVCSAMSIGMQGHIFADGDVNRLRERLSDLLKA